MLASPNIQHETASCCCCCSSQHVLQEISDYELQRLLTIERNNVRAPS